MSQPKLDLSSLHNALMRLTESYALYVHNTRKPFGLEHAYTTNKIIQYNNHKEYNYKK